jgi:hypothetical protein
MRGEERRGGDAVVQRWTALGREEKEWGDADAGGVEYRRAARETGKRSAVDGRGRAWAADVVWLRWCGAGMALRCGLGMMCRPPSTISQGTGER